MVGAIDHGVVVRADPAPGHPMRPPSVQVDWWGMARVTRADLPPAPIILVTLSDGTEDVDDRVLCLAHAEAQSQGLRIGAYFGILDEPDAQLLCHVFTVDQPT